MTSLVTRFARKLGGVGQHWIGEAVELSNGCVMFGLLSIFAARSMYLVPLISEIDGMDALNLVARAYLRARVPACKIAGTAHSANMGAAIGEGAASSRLRRAENASGFGRPI